MKSLTLAKIMTTAVNQVAKTTLVHEALATLTNSGHSCLLIVDESNRPEGIITQQSLLNAIATAPDYTEFLNTPCTHASSNVVRANEDTAIEEALALINIQNVKHLVIMNDDNEISGLVTHTDLVNSYATMLADTKAQMEMHVKERTQELESVNRKLASMSLIDPLTNLSNRRALQVDIMKTHAASIRHGHSYSVAMIDIDYFKKYNDHYGHQMGDSALQDVAQILKNAVRETDYLYRYGGEEFLILMPETNAEEAKVPLKRIISQMATSAITHERSPIGFLTLSAGLASSNPRLIGWREVIELADRRLYDAKSNGRNQFFVKDDPASLQVLKSG